MIKEGTEEVIELDDLITYLQSVREIEGNLKLTVNGNLVYDLEDNIIIEPMGDTIEITSVL